MKLKNLIAVMLSATALFSFVSAVLLVDKKSSVAASVSPTKTVVIDAGHGGVDSGAVSSDGIMEKNINLDIALKLNDILTSYGIKTVMIRQTDTDISDAGCESVREKKISDIHNRFDIVNETANSILVSIHQNYYEEPKYSGAQVFYSPNDDESRLLAEQIQQSVVNNLQKENMRRVKASGDSIYLLYRAQRPSVMVECGFLSNPEEAQKLNDEEYRRQLALFIADGILNYLGGNPDGSEN